MSRLARTRSIRFRITALAALVVFGVLLVAGLGLVVVQRRVLTESLSENLSRRAEEVTDAVAEGRSPGDRVGVGDDDAYVLVTADDGSVVASIPQGVVDQDTHGFLEVTRVVDTSVGQLRVVVAGPLDDIDEATRVLVISLMVAIPVVVAVLALLIWWLIGRTLRPVEAIRSEVADISGADLHRRVPTPASGDEIESLARTMNDMLGRIEDATARQRRFVADASHELRTPLTRMRTQLEVELSHPGGQPAPDIERSILEDTLGMQRLVDDLLYLARSDSHAHGQLRGEPVDVDDIVHAQATRLQQDGVAVRIGPLAAVSVHGDARALDRAVGNVVENAVRYAATEVTLTMQQEGDTVIVRVGDDGPGVPREDRERIFERFARVDDARSATTGGTGLGLSIARDIIERHNGAISLESNGAPGAHFVIRLPVDHDASSR